MKSSTHSILSAAFLGLAILGLAFLGLARATAPPPETPAPPESWFSETAYELVGLSGAFSIHTTPSSTRFRPLGQGAGVELRELSTGLVIDRGVPLAGELAIGNGWIVVNTVDRETF